MRRYSKKMKRTAIPVLAKERKAMKCTRAVRVILRIMENSQGGSTRIFIYKRRLRDVIIEV